MHATAHTAHTPRHAPILVQLCFAASGRSRTLLITLALCGLVLFGLGFLLFGLGFLLLGFGFVLFAGLGLNIVIEVVLALLPPLLHRHATHRLALHRQMSHVKRTDELVRTSEGGGSRTKGPEREGEHDGGREGGREGGKGGGIEGGRERGR